MYTGLMYNDIFSKSLDIWHSGWDFHPNGTEKSIGVDNGHRYPFGLDPGWHGADNSLVFVNSYKMKMSVVLGVIHVRSNLLFMLFFLTYVPPQMTFALCLQLPNHLKFKRPLDIYANFIPQMIFLQSIFGYLVICILYKWSIDWSNASTSPPSLLNMLISMFLSPGTVDPAEQLYPGQPFVQVVLLLLAVVCVPWLLVTKPYFAWKEMHAIKKQGYVSIAGDAPQDGRRDSSDDALEGEEEGNGAIAEDGDDDGHVRTSQATFLVLINSPSLCIGSTRLW